MGTFTSAQSFASSPTACRVRPSAQHRRAPQSWPKELQKEQGVRSSGEASGKSYATNIFGDDPKWADPAFDDSAWPVATGQLIPTPPPASDEMVWLRYQVAVPPDRSPMASAWIGTRGPAHPASQTYGSIDDKPTTGPTHGCTCAADLIERLNLLSPRKAKLRNLRFVNLCWRTHEADHDAHKTESEFDLEKAEAPGPGLVFKGFQELPLR
jgi:hypothetical protein